MAWHADDRRGVFIRICTIALYVVQRLLWEVTCTVCLKARKVGSAEMNIAPVNKDGCTFGKRTGIPGMAKFDELSKLKVREAVLHAFAAPESDLAAGVDRDLQRRDRALGSRYPRDATRQDLPRGRPYQE